MASPSDFPYLQYINTINLYNFNGQPKSLFDFTSWTNSTTATPYYSCDFSQASIILSNLQLSERINPTSTSGIFALPLDSFVRIDVNSQTTPVTVTYSSYNIISPFPDSSFPQLFTSVYQGRQTGFYYQFSLTPSKPIQSTFNTLSDAISYIFGYYSLIDLYVDGENWVRSSPLPPYNWQSVPSISGKNGILTLSTLNDVNDGEPVETSDTSKFNLTDDSNVSALVAAHFSE